MAPTHCPYDGEPISHVTDSQGWDIYQPCGHPAPPAPERRDWNTRSLERDEADAVLHALLSVRDGRQGTSVTEVG